jgi:alpha-1,6-mannosyltransferase
MTSVLVAAGIIYLFLIGFAEKTQLQKNLMIWIIAIGIGLRIIMVFSTPILEDDYFRYLWDGAVTANGINPYRYAPQSVIEDDANIPPALKELAAESGKVVQRINHPHIRTIYPPVTQLFFAIGHLLSPWKISGWKFVLLVVDIVNLILLLSLLRILNLAPFWVAVYWWNPLLVKEIFNSGHMDILTIPFVFGAILLLLKNRHLFSSVLLALGIGVKLWPVLLLPVFLKRIYPDHKKMISFLLIFALIGITLFIPIHFSGVDDTSGFQVYAKSWENNDAFFMAVVWMWKFVLPIFGIHPWHAQLAGRITVLGILAILILFLILRKREDGASFINQCLVIVAAGFLISPTQFPWYFVWVIPFLTTKPMFSLLILTALLPFYYLRFYLEPRGMISLFNSGIVWLEFLPVWFLLLRDWFNSHKLKLTTQSLSHQ